MKGKKMKKGFTLAEALTTMGIIGVVAAIGIPAVVSRRPNQEIVMYRKAYFTIEKVVSELVNDEDFYDSTRGRGLTDTGNPAPNTSQCAGGNGKFCCLFVEKVNSIDPPACVAADRTVVTSDGIAYTLPVSNFAATQRITVDVNGNNGANCGAWVNGCPAPDQFRLSLAPTGRITIDNTDPAGRVYLTVRDLTVRTLQEARNAD